MATDAYEIKFAVKEDHVGNAFLEIEWMKETQSQSRSPIHDRILFLKFGAETTVDQAQAVARELNGRSPSLSVLSR